MASAEHAVRADTLLDDGTARNGQGAHVASAPEASVRYYESPGRSAMARPRLVVAIAVVLAVLGAAGGAARHPTYSASEQLYVGKTLSLGNTAAIAGLSAAANTIASDYSRLISTASVRSAAAAALHTSTLPGSLTATEIADSPQITVTGTGPTQQAALDLATAGSSALLAAVATINSDNQAQLKSLLSQYTTLNASINADNQQITALTAAAAKPNAPADTQSRLAAAQADLATLQLQASAVQAQYQAAYNPLQQEEQVLQSVGPAAPDGSNRSKTIELGGFAGLVVGLLAGIALASYLDLRSGRRVRRSAGS